VRSINWRYFKDSSILHIGEVLSCEFISYDINGRIYELSYDPADTKPIIIWARIKLFNQWLWNNWGGTMEFGFKDDAYVFGWEGHRLSSLPNHEYYWRHALWLTMADRDFIIGEFLGLRENI
jgi:hypothetical protein